VQIPSDLEYFLKRGLQLEFPAEECETGKVVLLPLEQLRIELFPTDVDNGPLDNTSDPHHRELGCYLIPAVSLIGECENFDPSGLLLWLPEEGAYGTWDSSHTLVEAFSTSVNWSDIANDPARYLNAPWDDERLGGLAPLVPWPKYEYDRSQPTAPRPFQ
jgi:hypothetical protein